MKTTNFTQKNALPSSPSTTKKLSQPTVPRLSGGGGKTVVSRKFYLGIAERVEETCRLVSADGSLFATVMALINAFLLKISGDDSNRDCESGGEIIASDAVAEIAENDVAVKMIFSLLRPELERAVARSKAARIRAAKRWPRNPLTENPLTDLAARDSDNSYKSYKSYNSQTSHSSHSSHNSQPSLKAAPTAAGQPVEADVSHIYMSRRERRRILNERRRAARKGRL